MKNILMLAASAVGMIMMSAPAFAGTQINVPEPLSMSLLAGGIVALAAVKGLRRK